MASFEPREHPSPIMRNTIKIRLSRFLYIFNLRQGAILIAVQQIALSACVLMLLLVAIAHVQEMMDFLNSDMEDNAEREGTILIDEDDSGFKNDIPLEATNNQQKFKIAQNLATMIVFMLYGSLVGTAIYLVFCVALFYGAAKNKREYVLPWTFLATFAVLLFGGLLITGDKNQTIIKIFGGHAFYRFGAAVFLMGHLYCVLAVASFIYELSQTSWKAKQSESLTKLHMETNEKNSLIIKDNTLIIKDNIKFPLDDSFMGSSKIPAKHV